MFATTGRRRDVMGASEVEYGHDPAAIEMTGDTWSSSRGELGQVRRLVEPIAPVSD